MGEKIIYHSSAQLLRNKSPSVGTAAFFVTDEKAKPFGGNEVTSVGKCML